MLNDNYIRYSDDVCIDYMRLLDNEGQDASEYVRSLYVQKSTLSERSSSDYRGENHE